MIDAVRARCRVARDRRCSSAASRWAAASRRRSPPPIRRCRSRAWCCSAIRCIRRASPTSGATSTCRRSRRPMLFVQGTRDAFGTPDELAPILGALAAAAAAARRRAGRSLVQAVEEGSGGAGGGLSPTCSARSSASYLQLHDVAAVREAVPQVQRHAARGRPQDHAIDAGWRGTSRAPSPAGACRCRRARRPGRTDSTGRRAARSSAIGFGIFWTVCTHICPTITCRSTATQAFQALPAGQLATHPRGAAPARTRRATRWAGLARCETPSAARPGPRHR